MASPLIMSAFQAVRVFSSRAGQTRKLRAFRSFERDDSIIALTFSADSLSDAAMSSIDAQTCRCHSPSKLAGRFKPNRSEKAAYSGGVNSDCTSLEAQT